MKLSINGNKASLDQVSANHGLNFSRFDFEGVEIDNYELVFEREEFIALMQEEFNQARNEIKADDLACNETSDFTSSGYAELNEMFHFKEELSEIISTYLHRELFEKVLPLEINEGYIINSTDVVDVTNTSVTISGRTYRWPVNKSLQQIPTE